MRGLLSGFMLLCASLYGAPRAHAADTPMLPVAFERADPMWGAARQAIGSSVACIARRDAACVTPTIAMLLEELADAPLLFQLDVINRWFNKATYVPDFVNWKTVDHWETIQEFLSRGGDCEDFAIAKYGMLRALGLPPEQMRLLIVEDRRKREIHAVLAVDTPTGTRLLDNQLPDVTLLNAASQYRTRVAINENDLWRKADLPLVSASASRR
jgi:predicted transglutaminase-like cysteine proteinase